MSEPQDKLRTAVARKLRFRRWRWHVLAATVALEACGLFALVRDPVVLVFLPALACLPLVSILIYGRYRLPNDECESDPDFAGQAFNVASCSATHTYIPTDVNKEVQDNVLLDIRLRRRFNGVRSRKEFVVIRDADVFLIVTARSYWLWYARRLHFGDVRTIGINLLEWTDRVRYKRGDDEIVGATWLHATKHGKRDLRYRANHRIWEVRRYGVELSFGELQWQIELYSQENTGVFANAFSAISGRGLAMVYSDKKIGGDGKDNHGDDSVYDDSDVKDSDGDVAGEEEISRGGDKKPVRHWHDVLGTKPDAAADVIKAAYRERLKEYHPDRVAHLGEKLRSLAGEEALAINQAYAEAMLRWR